MTASQQDVRRVLISPAVARLDDTQKAARASKYCMLSSVIGASIGAHRRSAERFAALVGIAATSHVAHHVAILERQGLLRREPPISQALTSTRAVGLVVQGTIAAGEPIDLFDSGEPGLLKPVNSHSQQPLPQHPLEETSTFCGCKVPR